MGVHYIICTVYWDHTDAEKLLVFPPIQKLERQIQNSMISTTKGNMFIRLNNLQCSKAKYCEEIAFKSK